MAFFPPKPVDDKKMMADDSMEYNLVPRNRLEEVNDLLLKHFFANEPLGVSLGADPEKDVRPWISRVTKPILDQKVRARFQK